MKNKSDLPQRFEKHLGKKSDTEIAKEAGVSVQVVHRLRTKLGIPKYNRLEHGVFASKEFTDLLGKLVDREIAEKFNVSLLDVHAVRTQLGIAPVRSHPTAKKNRLAENAEFRELVGKVSDVALAKKFKASANTVRLARRKLNVATYKPTASTAAEIVRDQLGKTTDAELAKMANVSRERIRQLRAKHQIEKYDRVSAYKEKCMDNRDVLESKIPTQAAAELGVPLSAVMTTIEELGISPPEFILLPEELKGILRYLRDDQLIERYDWRRKDIQLHRETYGIPEISKQEQDKLIAKFETTRNLHLLQQRVMASPNCVQQFRDFFNIPLKVKCKYCGDVFIAGRNQKTCSKECNYDLRRSRWLNRSRQAQHV